MRDLARIAIAFAIWFVADQAAAHAQIPDKALRAFDDGHFVAAAEIAEAAGDADALAFAARARIADAVTRDHIFCLPCLVHAEATARQAINRDPNYSEGYVQYAVAIGFRGRLISIDAAQAEGLPEKGRDAIRKALELDPSNNWARAACNAWNLEVVHRAGRIIGSLMYGASEEDGVTSFRQALAADADNLILHLHFALSILAVDVEKYRADAAHSLEQGLKDHRTDALTRQMRGLVLELQRALHTQSDEEIARLVHKLQGYPEATEPIVAKPM